MSPYSRDDIIRHLFRMYRKDPPERDVVATWVSRLMDVAEDILRDACRRATDTRRVMPTIAQLREDTEWVQLKRATQIRTTAPQVMVCDRCEDTGFAYLRPDGSLAAGLTEAVLHRHRKVRECACRATNPNIKIKRAQDLLKRGPSRGKAGYE